jgi:hypothetical protein
MMADNERTVPTLTMKAAVATDMLFANRHQLYGINTVCIDLDAAMNVAARTERLIKAAAWAEKAARHGKHVVIVGTSEHLADAHMEVFRGKGCYICKRDSLPDGYTNARGGELAYAVEKTYQLGRGTFEADIGRAPARGGSQKTAATAQFAAN